MTDAPISTTSVPAKKHSPLVKWGWVICASGLGVTTIGAILLAQGQSSYELAADFVHRFGMFSMLAGLFLLLVGYRVPMFKKLWLRIQETVNTQSSAFGGAEATVAERNYSRRATHPELSVQLVMSWLIVLMALAGVASVLLFAAPIYHAMLIAVLVNVALPAVFTVALVYGRRYLRAFCIAALFPACLAMWTAWSRLTTLLTMGPRGFRFNQPQELELRISVFLQWGLIFAIGALGAGVWFVLAVIQFGGNRRGDSQ